jgi:hypothetical protein
MTKLSQDINGNAFMIDNIDVDLIKCLAELMHKIAELDI